jgi:putative FmdB family regulatory protein
MPLYEYRCEGCGKQFEVIQKFSDQPLTTHDGCGGPVHRMLSAPALQFKGSGWYVNDYAKTSKPESDGASKKAESTPAANSSPESSKTTSTDTTSSDKKTTPSATKNE